MPPPIVYNSASLTLTVKGKSVTAIVVTSATATLTSTNMTGGSGPDGKILPPGWGGGSCPAHHNRGHLIGNHLGGPGDEKDNLVTLTAGTNHPFMYEYEDAVRRCVLANPGTSFTYTVECIYDGYQETPGFAIPGASGNPFCLFPAPAGLMLSLIRMGKYMTLKEVCDYLPTPPTDLGTAGLYIKLPIANGGYKLYSGATHTANTCWSVVQDAHSATVQTAANDYAKALGWV